MDSATVNLIEFESRNTQDTLQSINNEIGEYDDGHRIKIEENPQVEVLQSKIHELNQEIETLNRAKEGYLKQLSCISNEKTTQKARNESILMARNSVSKRSTQIIDVMKAMMRGTQLMKYGRVGNPKYHQFEISCDCVYLRWYSKKKKLKKKKTQIKLESIVHLQCGHLYKQQSVDSKSHERAFSLSCMIHNKAQTLEVSARNRTDFEIWTKGLQFIIKTIKDIRKRNVKYDAKLHFAKECFMEIHERNIALYEKALANKSDPPQKQVEKNYVLVEAKYEEVVKLLNKLVETRTSDNYEVLDSVDVTKQRLNELQPQIKQISHDLKHNTKKLSVLTYKMHDIMIELKAFHEKLFVLCTC
eukprot:176911_1